MAIWQLKVPVGAPYFMQRSMTIKVGYPAKGVWYEPTGTAVDSPHEVRT